jgi:hypothetical protein
MASVLALSENISSCFIQQRLEREKMIKDEPQIIDKLTVVCGVVSDPVSHQRFV